MDASLGEAALILPAALGRTRSRVAVEEGVAPHRPLRRVLVAYSAIERTVRGEPRELEA